MNTIDMVVAVGTDGMFSKKIASVSTVLINVVIHMHMYTLNMRNKLKVEN